MSLEDYGALYRSHAGSLSVYVVKKSFFFDHLSQWGAIIFGALLPLIHFGRFTYTKLIPFLPAVLAMAVMAFQWRQERKTPAFPEDQEYLRIDKRGVLLPTGDLLAWSEIGPVDSLVISGPRLDVTDVLILPLTNRGLSKREGSEGLRRLSSLNAHTRSFMRPIQREMYKDGAFLCVPLCGFFGSFRRIRLSVDTESIISTALTTQEASATRG